MIPIIQLHILLYSGTACSTDHEGKPYARKEECTLPLCKHAVSNTNKECTLTHGSDSMTCSTSSGSPIDITDHHEFCLSVPVLTLASTRCGCQQDLQHSSSCNNIFYVDQKDLGDHANSTTVISTSGDHR